MGSIQGREFDFRWQVQIHQGRPVPDSARAPVRRELDPGHQVRQVRRRGPLRVPGQQLTTSQTNILPQSCG